MEYTFSMTFKMYLVIHILPVLLFKRKELRKDPLKVLSKVFKGWSRSMLFILLFPFAAKVTPCYLKKYIGFQAFGGAVGATLSTLGIFFEQGARKTEITMYVLPRWFEGMYLFL